MNQSILFSDDQLWNSELRQIEFSAFNMGSLIVCVVPVETLERIGDRKVTEEILAFEQFKQFQFDIEELAEVKIQEEIFNNIGQVVID